MAAPLQQIFMMLSSATAVANAIKYWFNGLPLSSVSVAAQPTGAVKYWFNGLPTPVVKSS